MSLLSKNERKQKGKSRKTKFGIFLLLFEDLDAVMLAIEHAGFAFFFWMIWSVVRHLDLGGEFGGSL